MFSNLFDLMCHIISVFIIYTASHTGRLCIHCCEQPWETPGVGNCNYMSITGETITAAGEIGF